MATISSPGIGSGLDIKSIVSQLVALEKKPLEALQVKAKNTETRISAMGQIQSQLARLDDALKTLKRGSTFDPMTVSSSNSAAVTGTAVFTATPAIFSLEVSQLARAQTAASNSFTAGSFPGAGTMTIETGNWGSGSFVDNGATKLEITVGATDTLTDIASKINELGGNVAASVINDGAGEKLLLRSKLTGEANGFRVQVSDTVDGINNDANGLSRLAYDPAAATAGLTLAQSGLDTEATINGVPLTSANNQFSGVVNGVTIDVKQTTSGPVTLEIGRNTTEVAKSITAFVDAFNAVSATLKDATKYDPATRVAGPFQGDSTTLTLQSRLKQMLAASGPFGNPFGRLSDVGLELQTDGSLKVNDGKLQNALQDTPSLKTFFTATTGSPSGLAVQLQEFTAGLIGETGRVTQKTKDLQSSLGRYAKDQTKLEDRISRTESRLLAQYSRLDTNVAKLNAINSYVSQQITNWNKSSG